MGWGTEVLEEIQEVSIDFCIGYKTIVNELMPNVQVVANIFHVMAIVNHELDRQIKSKRSGGYQGDPKK